MLKLIRDGVAHKIGALNYPPGSPQVRPVPREQLTILLVMKLQEEVTELIFADEENFAEELVDVFEVIRTICREAGITVDELIRLADLKVQQDGGLGRWVLEW